MSDFINDTRNSYMTPDGIVGNQTPAAKTDNNYYMTATYHSILSLLGLVDPVGVQLFNQYIEARQLKSGLPDVEPSWSLRQLSHDEINGLVSYSSQAKVRQIFWYGILNNWTFRNRPWSEVFDVGEELTVWGKIKLIALEYGEEWMWRMGYLVPFIYVRTGFPVPFHHQLFYFIKMYLETKEVWGQTSNACLYRLHFNYHDDFPWLMRMGHVILAKHLTNQYGDVGGLYSIYYGPNHPHAVYTRGIPFLKERS